MPALEGDRGCLWQGLGGWARLGAVGASEATCACPGPSCTQGSQDSPGGWRGSTQPGAGCRGCRVSGGGDRLGGPGEREGFLPHLESLPVIISIQLVVSGAQNGERGRETCEKGFRLRPQAGAACSLGQALGEGAEPGVGLRGCGQGVGLRWVEPGVGGSERRGSAEGQPGVGPLSWAVERPAWPALPSALWAQDTRLGAERARSPAAVYAATSVSSPWLSVAHVAAGSHSPLDSRWHTLSRSLLGLAVLGLGVGKAAEPGVEGGCLAGLTGASPPWAGWGPYWSDHQISWPGARGAPASAPSSSGSRTELAGQECPVWGEGVGKG